LFDYFLAVESFLVESAAGFAVESAAGFAGAATAGVSVFGASVVAESLHAAKATAIANAKSTFFIFEFFNL
jgi:hypothetical protein